MAIQTVSYPRAASLLKDAQNYAETRIQDAKNFSVGAFPVVLVKIGLGYMFPTLSGLSALFVLGYGCSRLAGKHTEIKTLKQKQTDVAAELGNQPKLLEQVQKVYQKQIGLLEQSRDRTVVGLCAESLFGIGCFSSGGILNSLFDDATGITLGSAGYAVLTGLLSDPKPVETPARELKDAVAEAEKSLAPTDAEKPGVVPLTRAARSA